MRERQRHLPRGPRLRGARRLRPHAALPRRAQLPRVEHLPQPLHRLDRGARRRRRPLVRLRSVRDVRAGLLDACPSTKPLCSVAGAGGAGEQGGSGGAGGQGGVVTVSFAVAVQPLLEQRCVSCHEDGTAGGLFLPTGQAAENHLTLTARQTACDKFKTYVVPGKPDESYLYLKVLDTTDPAAICGTRMPPPSSAPLPAEEVETIRQWILTGANP
jgi:hypothetical protein